MGNHTRCKRVARVCQHQLSFFFIHSMRMPAAAAGTSRLAYSCTAAAGLQPELSVEVAEPRCPLRLSGLCCTCW